jgi:hypothetical protein
VIVIDVAGGAVDATRLGPFVWLAVGDTLVQYTAMAGVEQRRVSMGGAIRRVGSAGGDLVVSLDGETVRCGPPSWEPSPLDVGHEVALLPGDQVVWLTEEGVAHRVREHHLDPPIEFGAALATVVGDELWWVDPGGRIESSMRRRLGSVDGELPYAMVGCSGWLWLAHGTTLDRRSFIDGSAGRPLESPVGRCRHLACNGGVLVGASRRRVFLYDPTGAVPPSVVDPGVAGDIVALVPGPDLVWAVSDGPQAAIIRFD